MGSCERCGGSLTTYRQIRFCSKRCAGFRPVPTEKTCTRCGETHPVEAFRHKRGRPYSWCRACEAVYALATAAANRATVRARKAASERKRRADPTIGPRLRAIQQHYHRFRGSTPDDRLYASVLRHDPCAYCGERAGEVDHIMATAVGGGDHWDNLTAACRSCNAQKNDSPMLWWIGHRIVSYELRP